MINNQWLYGSMVGIFFCFHRKNIFNNRTIEQQNNRKMEYIALITGFLIILAGLWAIITRKNIIKMIIGFSLFDTGLHIVMVSLAYVKGSTAPILDSAVGIEAATKIADPVPQALVLTAIVIGLGVTALMLAFAIKLHKSKGSLQICDFKDMKW